MTTTTTPKDKASIAREMIRAEADHLAAKHKERAPNYEPAAKAGDIDFQAGVIEGLRKSERLLSEGT